MVSLAHTSHQTPSDLDQASAAGKKNNEEAKDCGAVLASPEKQTQEATVARRKKRQRQQPVPEHDVPLSDRMGVDVVKLRHEEQSQIKSPSLSHEDLCRLADGITVGQDK